MLTLTSRISRASNDPVPLYLLLEQLSAALPDEAFAQGRVRKVAGEVRSFLKQAHVGPFEPNGQLSVSDEGLEPLVREALAVLPEAWKSIGGVPFSLRALADSTLAAASGQPWVEYLNAFWVDVELSGVRPGKAAVIMTRGANPLERWSLLSSFDTHEAAKEHFEVLLDGFEEAPPEGVRMLSIVERRPVPGRSEWATPYIRAVVTPRGVERDERAISARAGSDHEAVRAFERGALDAEAAQRLGPGWCRASWLAWNKFHPEVLFEKRVEGNLMTIEKKGDRFLPQIGALDLPLVSTPEQAARALDDFWGVHPDRQATSEPASQVIPRNE